MHEGEGLFKNLMGAAGVNKVGAGAGLKMVLKNTYEGDHLLLKFSGHGQKFVTF